MVVETAQKVEEEKKHTSGDSSSDDEETTGVEGVTEDQAKVAEAAGLGDQVDLYRFLSK
jgi:hypothetical protein